MRWHKEGIHDSEDTNIMSHVTDAEAWQALDRFDLEFARGPRVSVLIYRRMVYMYTDVEEVQPYFDMFDKIFWK
jgi:hypothetical protein